jgi:serine/threonine protein kinase
LVLELLGNDLEDLMKKNKNRKFSLKTVLMIGLQVIDRLEAFHKIGYLHRDIKP